MKVRFKTGSPVTPERMGEAIGFVHVPIPTDPEPFDPTPNLWAVVVDENTGTFCAVRLYDMKARIDR